MKINSDTLPIILGSGLILLVFAGVGGMLMSYADTRATQEQQKLQDSFAAHNKKEEDKFKVSAPPLPPTQGTGDALESQGRSSELSIGDYSNPPTDVTTFGSSTTPSRIEHPIGNRHSSSSSLSSGSLTQTRSAPSIGTQNNRFSDHSSSNPDLGSESSVTPLEEDNSLGSIDTSRTSLSDRDEADNLDDLDESRF